MGVIKKILTRHILYCPRCGEELYSYSTSSDGTNYYKCISCLLYYERNNKEKVLVETDIPNRINEKFFKHDKTHVYYHGTPTSIEFKPKWLLWIEKFRKKK